jgi:hypothetical protein
LGITRKVGYELAIDERGAVTEPTSPLNQLASSEKMANNQ